MGMLLNINNTAIIIITDIRRIAGTEVPERNGGGYSYFSEWMWLYENSSSLLAFGWVVGVVTMSLPIVPISSQAAFFSL